MKQSSPLMRFYLILRWVLAASVLVAAGLTVFHTAAIYQEGLASGEQMYTYEIIAAHFTAMRWSVFCFLALLAAAVIFHLALPAEKTHPSSMTPEAKLELTARNRKPNEAMLRERSFRHRLAYGTAAVLILCLIWLLVQALRPDFFSGMDLEAVMGQALPVLLIPVLIGFIAGGVCLTLWGKSCQREAEAAKDAEKAEVPMSFHKSKALPWVRIALLLLAVTFLALGVVNGGLHAMFVKAINICTECIGLG